MELQNQGASGEESHIGGGSLLADHLPDAVGQRLVPAEEQGRSRPSLAAGMVRGKRAELWDASEITLPPLQGGGRGLFIQHSPLPGGEIFVLQGVLGGCGRTP